MIQMSINLSGFSTIDEPSEHGFHVHQTGNISAGCEGAGAHFNPFNMTHGGPVDPERSDPTCNMTHGGPVDPERSDPTHVTWHMEGPSTQKGQTPHVTWHMEGPSTQKGQTPHTWHVDGYRTTCVETLPPINKHVHSCLHVSTRV